MDYQYFPRDLYNGHKLGQKLYCWTWFEDIKVLYVNILVSSNIFC